MAGENRSKINILLSIWPANTVATLPWLAKQGISQQLAYEYERARWIQRVGRGAYARSGDKVDWLGGVYALQEQLGLAVHVGGTTALELHGLAHFVPGGEGACAYLYSRAQSKLPAWFLKCEWKRRIVFKMPKLFEDESDLALSRFSLGAYEVRIAAPERAILEVLHLVPQGQSFVEAFLLMEGLTTLRPKLLQSLLEKCRSIKVKRLFLYMADHCQHAWVKKLDAKKIKLGSGKRVIVSGGKLDPKYGITVPRGVPETEG